MSDQIPSETPDAADSIMLRLKEDAKALRDPNDRRRRSGTLERLIIACNEIQSGKALETAISSGFDATYFYAHKRLTPEAVAHYVNMKKKINPGSDWTGPKARTIRGDKDGLYPYVIAREARKGRHKARPRIGGRGRDVEDVINRLSDLQDQAILRLVVEEGRVAKIQLDTLRHLLRKLPGMDFSEETPITPETFASLFATTLSPVQHRTLSNLYDRITNNSQLLEMGLIYRNGRIKMDYAPGNDLVLPEELALIARLIGRPESNA